MLAFILHCWASCPLYGFMFLNVYWFYVFKRSCLQCSHAFCSLLDKMSTESGTLALKLLKKKKKLWRKSCSFSNLEIYTSSTSFSPIVFLISFPFQFYNVFFFSVVYTYWKLFFSLLLFVCCYLTFQLDTLNPLSGRDILVSSACSVQRLYIS